MKIFLVLIGFVVWSMGSSWYYVCKIKLLCDEPLAILPEAALPSPTLPNLIVDDKTEFNQTVIIEFDKAKAIYKADTVFDHYLDKLSNYLINNKSIVVKITGNSDSVGTEEKNYLLGMARANVIKEQLISRQVPSHQIKVESAGENNPIQSNQTEEGRKHNRRVEFEIVKP